MKNYLWLIVFVFAGYVASISTVGAAPLFLTPTVTPTGVLTTSTPTPSPSTAENNPTFERIVNLGLSAEIRGLVVAEDTGDFFVSAGGLHLRRLDADFKLLAETQLDQTEDGYSFAAGVGAGELALDSTRNRLYVSGYPAYVLEADTLALLETFPGGGQFALAPGGAEVYLSNCGVSILAASSLVSQTVLSGTDLPTLFDSSPCLTYSQLDPINQRLYSLAANGIPGSNSGNLLYVFDLMTAKPSLIFADNDLSAVRVLPDPTRRRAFVQHVRESNWQLRTLDTRARPRYTRQLKGITGAMLYNPTTNHLHVSDGQRLFILNADTLAVIGEMPLPPNYDYRLVALNPDSGHLYLAGLDGQLLIAKDGQTTSRQKNLTAMTTANAFPLTPAQPPNGPILDLHLGPDGAILARIQTTVDFQTDTRLFITKNEGAIWIDLSQTLPPNLPVQAVAIAPQGPASFTLVAALSETQGRTGGLYTSPDGGQTWSPTMTGLRDLAVNDLFIASEPDSDLILANTTHDGLHYSLDKGQTWTPATNPKPTAPFITRADSVAATNNEVVLAGLPSPTNPAGPDRLFQATVTRQGRLSPWRMVLNHPLSLLALAPAGQTVLGFAEGLWRSADGGLTWAAGGAGLVDLDRLKASRFLFSPDFSKDQTVYLFFQDIRGDASGRLFRSTDAGQTWQQWDNPPPSKRFTAVTLTPAGDFLFGDDTAQLTRLAPAAFSWAKPSLPTTPFPLDYLAVSPTFAQDKTLFAVSHQHGLFKSNNGGQSWQQTAFPVRSITLAGYRLALSPVYAEDQTLYLATGFSLHRSTDGGQRWKSLPLNRRFSGFAATQVSLSPHFAQDGTLLVTTPAAIVRSEDRGDTWRSVLTRPASAGEARVLLFSPTSGTAYTWFDYDTTLFLSNDGGRRWREQAGSPQDPFPVVTAALSPDDTLTLRPDFYPQLFQLSHQGQTRQELNDVLPPDFSNIQTLAYTPDGTLLAGGQGGLRRSLDNGQTWQSLSSGLPLNATVTHLQVSEPHLFVVLAGGQILVSADGGPSWQDISVVR